MFARNVSLRLKPNTLSEFTRIFDKEVIPRLQKQNGFRDEITFSLAGGLDVVAISLWDAKEYAEAYNTAGYPEVLKMLDEVLDGAPKVQVSDVISQRWVCARIAESRFGPTAVGNAAKTHSAVNAMTPMWPMYVQGSPFKATTKNERRQPSRRLLLGHPR